MAAVQEVVRLGRNLRKREGHRVRQPLSSLTVLTRNQQIIGAIESHADILTEELNIKEVRTTDDESSLVALSSKANFRKLGPELGSEMGRFAGLIADLSHDQIDRLIQGEDIELAGRTITNDDVIVERTPNEDTLVETGEGFAVALDTRITDELLREGFAREVISNIQRMRREYGLEVSDRIELSWHSTDDLARKAIAEHSDRIQTETLASGMDESDAALGADTKAEVVGVDGIQIAVALKPV